MNKGNYDARQVLFELCSYRCPSEPRKGLVTSWSAHRSDVELVGIGSFKAQR